MKKKYLISIILFSFFFTSFSQQKDTIYGNLKRIREKVEFLTKKENPQLFYYDDYGHSGFNGPESTIARFRRTWYSSDLCYYINYERHFDTKGRIIEDNWFTKKDSFMDSYKYKYDNKDRLIRKIDSSEYAVGKETHYYTNDYHENIFYEHFEYEIYSYKYKRYNKDGKIIRFKIFDEYGIIDEFIYKYNAQGKLKYRIYKNPNSWKKSGEKSMSYGPQDSIGNVYKDLVNEYDKSNRLIKRLEFDLKKDDVNRNKSKLSKSTIYKYNKNNLTQVVNKYSNRKASFINYKYDKENRLVEKYCCSENKSDAKIIEKYFYKDDEIKALEYTKQPFPSKEKKTYKIKFKYKYDKTGNWTEIVKTVDGIELYKWLREIEYF